MANNQTSFDLDLDTLTGKSKFVKLNGKVIEVLPPSLEELFNLQSLADEFKGLDAKNLTEDETKFVFDKLQGGLLKLIPSLSSATKKSKFSTFVHKLFGIKENRSSLTLSQVYALINLVLEMSVPTDLKELKRNNITLNSNKKK
jgi:hypothetical protein